MTLEQADSAFMAHDDTRDCNLVAIKRFKRLGFAKSTQVVEVKDMFFDQHDLVVIYEPMDISLREITGITQSLSRNFRLQQSAKR